MHGLYVITDPDLIAPEQLTHTVAQAIAGGASMVQYRNKHADEHQQQWEAQDLQNLCQGLSIPLVINDNMQLAHTVGAAGVHLGQDDGEIAKARALLGPKAIIGASCYQSLDHAKAAEKAGASYVAFGRFFTSHTKPHAAQAPLAVLAEAKQILGIPVVAIGGITQENCRTVIQAGADMVAVIHSVFGQASAYNAAQLLCNQLASAAS